MPPNPSDRRNVPHERDLPPKADRLCVRVGLARITPTGTIEYDWPAIAQVWLQYPGDNQDFCRHLGIPRNSLDNAAKRSDYGFSSAKKQAIRSIVSKGYRSEVLRLVGVGRSIATADSALALSEILSDLVEVARLTSSFAKAKIVKMHNGTPIANPNLPTREVKELSAIASNSAATLRSIFDIEKSIMSRNARVRKAVESEIKSPPPEPSEKELPQ